MSHFRRPASRSQARLLAALLAAVLAALLADAPAEATWPGGNGAIAFTRGPSASLSETDDIWIELRSGEQRQLTHSRRAAEESPVFSPDGRWIAYVRRAGEDTDIWLMRSDGSGKRPLVASGQAESEPSFYPSGRSLVFTRFDGHRQWTVFSVRRSGERLRRQVGNASSPIVSPDGRWLAYSRHGDGGGIRLRDLRDGSVRQLTSGSAQGLDFSPDGRRILYGSLRDCRPRGPSRFAIVEIGLRERRPRVLRRSCNGSAGSAYSPDGRLIVHTVTVGKARTSAEMRFRLALMRADGAAIDGGPRHLAGRDERSASWQPLP